MDRLRKNIFLIDGSGAVLTAFTHGLVLPYFNDYIGMPNNILYGLSFVAVIFAVYSLSCFFLVKINKKKWLSIIFSANLLYCAVSVLFVFIHYGQLSKLGITYFIAEFIVILLVARLELEVLRTIT